MNRHWLLLPHLEADFPLPLDAPFTTAQASGAGLTARHLRALVDAGLLRQPVRGVYGDARLPDTVRSRAAALRLVVPADAVICDRHAGWMHGAEMTLLPNEHLNLQRIAIFLPGGRGRLRNKLSDGGERTLRSGDVMEIEGLRVTTPLRTALDLGRQRFAEPALSALDALLRLGAFSKGELLADVERFRGMRWITTLRATAPLADGRAESPGESVLRLRCIESGLPTPEPQVEVHSRGRLAVIDVACERVHFGAEYFGREWHSSDEQVEHDEQRLAWLDEDEGWVMEPFWAEDIYGRSPSAYVTLRRRYDEARRRTMRRAA